MLAMMCTSPPHSLQVSIYPRAPSLDAAHQFTLSILNTRFNRLAQVIEARFSAGLWSCASYQVAVAVESLLAAPALESHTNSCWDRGTARKQTVADGKSGGIPQRSG